MIRSIILDVRNLFAVLFILAFAAAAARASDTYLLLSHDPFFLEEISAYAETVYSRGRGRLVELKVPASQVPPELMDLLRPFSASDLHYAPARRPVSRQPDPFILAVTSKADTEMFKRYTRTITLTGRRSTRQLDAAQGSGNRIAADFIADTLGGLGYSVETQCYRDRKKDKECNVIGRRLSGRPGARAILVVAHFDSVGHNNAGADDNASGAAGLLEMARVLAGFDSEHDLIFLAANGEETGILGSKACARLMKASGELARVDWAINMDMIAWNRNGSFDIETNREFSAYADWVASMAYTYTALKPNISMPAWGSDHVPFLDAGIPTYLSIESWEQHNPCYHRSCDTLDSLSWDYAMDIVRLNLAVVAARASLTPLR